ncbi:hypothetical protein ABZT51_47260 [Streptomyces sp. NPDC005373]|uniref:hypothetical protein n=1 Tax=Streptomyces sp. NPDC005373 TaxID=3156879 RepID=UPI0033A38E4C
MSTLPLGPSRRGVLGGTTALLGPAGRTPRTPPKGPSATPASCTRPTTSPAGRTRAGGAVTGSDSTPVPPTQAEAITANAAFHFRRRRRERAGQHALMLCPKIAAASAFTGNGPITTPCLLRLRRTGTTFTASASASTGGGATWTDLAQGDVPGFGDAPITSASWSAPATRWSAAPPSSTR